MPAPAPVSPEQPDDEVVTRLVTRVHDLAHDLNNALLAVRGYGEVLRATLQSPQQQADVDEITSAADRATDLTRQLFALAVPSPAIRENEDPEPCVETILLVEDDAQVREIVCRVLEGAGYRVLHAARPIDAVLLLERDLDVDLLLADIDLPEMSGYELAARIVETRPDLRLLFISGYPQPAASPPALDAELLMKPFTAGQLARSVRRALGDQKAEGAPVVRLRDAR